MSVLAAEKSLEAIRRRGLAHLRTTGISNARNECDWLMRAAFSRGTDVTPESLRRFDRMISERCDRNPIAYILGTQPFLHFEFSVDPSVLIPRPETELLVQIILAQPPGSIQKVLEIGTGSGCIAISLAAMRPYWDVTATDVSRAALRTAKKNAMLSGFSERIHFAESYFYRNLKKNQKFDAIVSNPPYIKSGTLELLQPEVQYEPRLALDGGPDGLTAIRALVDGASDHLNDCGILAIEIGYDQSRRVSALMRGAGFRNVRTVRDFQGIERIVMGDWMVGDRNRG